MIIRYDDFGSQFVQARHVEVWMPDGLAAGETLPVLYMQDGQNLFNPGSAYGGVDWGVDEAVDELRKAGRIEGAIVVGVWNSDQRWREYMPAKAMADQMESLVMKRYLEKAGGEPISDAYLACLVTEIKPFIDSLFPTRRGRESTFVAGSSMGGLISAYAVTQYPDVFGGAACLSTHWPAGEEALVEGLAAIFPPPGRHKFYFDHGTATLDAGYEPYQQAFNRLLEARGYTPGKDLLCRKFPGAEHNEAAWRERVKIPLEYLLGVHEDA